MPLGPNILADSGIPIFFELVNPADVGISPPETRMGDSLRTWIRSLSVFQKEALVASSRTGRVWRLASDEGPYLDGHDAAPCPLAFLSVGMIASYMNEITALAKQQGVAIRKLKLTQDNYYTEIDCDLADGPLNQFLMNAIHASPLNGLMRGHLESLFTLSKNGAELQPAKALRMQGPVYPDPGDHFAQAQPISKPAIERLCWPNGTTAKKAVTGGTSAAGSSLAAEQNRQLNIGATCTLRDDGMKEIIQLQYSPHGTSFKFLSEEAPENGGLGRAPDANSYISAGIGFCFMTQFGRFVKMLNLDLSDYRIVQDSHFSLGGASGGTGKAGTADPLETHVYLQTTESDDVAREMLDISEQTCFLHAFCKTDLKTKLKVQRV
jgi:uncharacterized OsmC-like protein